MRTSSIRIVPAAPALPANTLRFYIHFPKPAEAHFDRSRLWLLDEKERPVPEPFLVLSQALWSPDGRRLTVLLEPGRIKRGVGHEGLGPEGLSPHPSHEPALIAGRRYSLVLDAMGETARQVFCALDPVRDPLDEALWQLDPPCAGRRAPAVLHFDRVVDGELCESEISVVDPAGQFLPTLPVLDPDGRTLRIGIDAAWVRGEHRLVISDRFEDVCGNRLGEALDHGLGKGGQPRPGLMLFTPTATVPPL